MEKNRFGRLDNKKKIRRWSRTICVGLDKKKRRRSCSTGFEGLVLGRTVCEVLDDKWRSIRGGAEQAVRGWMTSKRVVDEAEQAVRGWMTQGEGDGAEQNLRD
jgi:hypothetical protein